MIANIGRKKIFIAGASGVIGRALCPLLTESGWSVIGMTRSADKTSRLRDLGVEPVVVDVFDRAPSIHALCAHGPLL